MAASEQIQAADPLIRKPVPEDCIAVVEEILSEMRAGRITAMLFAVKDDGYCTWNHWWAPKRADAVNLLGQMRVVEHSILAVWDERE